MKTFCIIPAFNESKTIVKVIEKVKPFVDNIVVIDDCSQDDTFTQAKTTGVTVLKHPINLGQGAALETGNMFAHQHGAEIVIHFDADDQFVAKEIPQMIKPLKEGYDMVFGSRFLNKDSNLPFFKKYLIIPLAKLVNFVFFGIKTTDPQSGFRAFNKKTLEYIKIENNGMAHCSEILAKAFKYKLKIKEVPITIIYHEFGQKLSGGFKILKDLFFSKLIR